MLLAQEIEELNRTTAPNIPEDVATAFQNAIQNWVANKIDKDALRVGDSIPSFKLNNHDGKSISSDDLLKQGPIIINFFRGGWCPYCNLELRAFQKHLNEIKKHKGSLVAISGELADSSINTVKENEINFPVLSDKNLLVARQFGLVFQLPEIIEDMTKNKFGLDLRKINGTDKFELPIPASYLVDVDHVIRYAYVNPNFMQRSEPSELVNALKNLGQ